MIDSSIYYLFPFEKIRFNSKVILYCAGKIGMDYLKQIQITEYCDVILAVDGDYEYINKMNKLYEYTNKINEIQVYPKEKILEHEKYADYILIASESYCEDIKSWLIGNGINEKKIVLSIDRKIRNYTKAEVKLNSLYNHEKIKFVLDEFLKRSCGNIRYLANIIEELKIATEEERTRIINVFEQFCMKEKSFKYTAIIFRLLYDARLIDVKWIKILMNAIRDTHGYNMSKYWLLQDINWINFKHKELEFDDFYNEMRELNRNVLKSFYLFSEKQIVKKKSQIDKIAIIDSGLSSKSDVHCKIVADIVYNLSNYAERELEIYVFCEDSLYYSDSDCFIKPIVSRNFKSIENAEIFDELIGRYAKIYYNYGQSVIERTNNLVDAVLDFNPDVIIDTCSSRSCSTGILYKYYPIIHRPLADEKDSAIFHKYLAGVRYKSCIEANKRFKTTRDEDIWKYNFPMAPFWDSKKEFLRMDYEISENQFAIITVGHRLDVDLTKEFIDNVYELLVNNNDITWFLVGKDKNEFINDYFMDKCKTLIEKKSIIIIPFEEELIGLYQICNAYLNPNRKGGGFSIQMAMQVGLPIAILEQSCDVLDILGRENFLKGGYKELMEYVERLKNDKLFYFQMQEIVKERFRVRIGNPREDVNQLITLMDDTYRKFYKING